MSNEKQYDAFLSLNSEDRAAVEAIARWLEDKVSLQVWLYTWSMIPGAPIQESMEEALDRSRSCVVFVGPEGIGPWQNEELRVALGKRVEDKQFRVVPVILPGAHRPQKESALPSFLRRLAWIEFRDVDDEESLQYLRHGILGMPFGRRPEMTVKEIVCPFRGLEVFREEDARFFFGREAMVQRLFEHIQTNRFLAVLGPSGSGKSSVVRAGLIPALKKRREHRASSPRPSAPSPLLYALFTPKERPIEELAFALQRLYKTMGEEQPTEKLLSRLQENERSLHYIAGEMVRAAQARQLFLIIDQFEEIFTQASDETERQQFLNRLLAAVENSGGPTAMILTMRSDFLGKCAAYPDLNTFVSENFIQIGPMSNEEMRRAITEPATLAGLDYEEGLVDTILDDVAGAPGELPLLEYALLELFERRKGVRLNLQAYQEIGGIAGALTRHVEAEYAKLDKGQKEILRKMFVLRLIQPGEGTEDTRRRATKEELLAAGGNAKEAETVLQQWTNARLLTTTRDEEKKQEIVEVAHEALIRTWQEVQKWLKDDRENSRLLGLVRRATQEWLASGKSADYLWLGAQLARAEELYVKHSENLTSAEKEFIQGGIARRDRETRAAEAQRQKELENVQRLAQARARGLKLARGIAAVVLLALVSVSLLYLQLERANKKTAAQLTRSYWEDGKRAQARGNLLLALHFITEAIQTAPSGDDIGQAAKQDWPVHAITLRLRQDYQEDASEGAMFSNDETRILTWGYGGARLWNADTGTPIGQPMQHKEYLKGAMFSKDEKRILTWSEDGSARLWNGENGDPIGQPMQHNRHIQDAVFSQDEKRILTWSLDGSARLWNANTGIPIGQPMLHENPVKEAVFSQDQKRILTWDHRNAHLWDAETGTPISQPMLHDVFVSGAIFSQDEKRILTWGYHGARLWNADTGTPIGQLILHEEVVKKAMFFKDQKRILTWSEDGSLSLWDAETGLPIDPSMPLKVSVNVPKFLRQTFLFYYPFKSMSPDKISVDGATSSKDGKRILTWGRGSGVRLWDAETGASVAPSMLLYEPVNGARFSKDEKRILTWNADGSARLWDAETGTLIGPPMLHEKSVTNAVFLKDEKHILTLSGFFCARLWDVETCTPTGPPMLNVKGAVFSRYKKRILTWGPDGVARLWEVEADTSVGQRMLHNRSVDGAVFSQDENCILTWSADSTVRLWDAKTGARIGQPMLHNGIVNGAMFSQDEKRILTWSADSTVLLWDANTGIPIGQTMHLKGNVWGAVFSKDEKRILTWSADSTARLWDTNTGTRIGQPMQHEKSVNGAMFSQQDEKSILTWSDDGTARLWDAATGNPLGQPMKHEESVNGALFSNKHEPRYFLPWGEDDGISSFSEEIFILTWSADNTARLWAGASLICPMFHKGSVNGAMFSKDEKRILTWSEDGSARLWNGENGDPIGQPMQHKGSVNGARFSKDEKRILTWSADGNIRLWEVEADFSIGQPMQHEKSVNGAVFSKDEKRILTWSNDSTARLWQAETGTPLGQPMQHEKSVNGAVFSKDEKRILTWSEDGTARLWDVPGDLDFPNDKYVLQVQALTGTKFDPATSRISVIPIDEWQEIQQKWLAFARKHAKKCQYKRQNVYLRFFPTDEK